MDWCRIPAGKWDSLLNGSSESTHRVYCVKPSQRWFKSSSSLTEDSSSSITISLAISPEKEQRTHNAQSFLALPCYAQHYASAPYLASRWFEGSSAYLLSYSGWLWVPRTDLSWTKALWNPPWFLKLQIVPGTRCLRTANIEIAMLTSWRFLNC